MADLKGKRILLGLTGGIAAYKAAELLRLLVKDGADVTVVMTENAKRFVGAATFQALSGKPVADDLWAVRPGIPIEHLGIARAADLAIVARPRPMSSRRWPRGSPTTSSAPCCSP